jgi:thiaminase/transcriptional activator TenA
MTQTPAQAFRAAAHADWDAAVHHRLVEELLAGTIADDVLGRYLAQDYHFFTAFLDELGRALATADTLDAKLALGRQIGFVTTEEDGYFQLAFDALGVPAAEQRAPALAPATAGFFELIGGAVDRGRYPELVILLYVAEALYLDWARRSAAEGRRPQRPEHHGWIDVHEGDAFRAWVAFLETELNRVADPTDPEQAALFAKAVALELAFFEDAYR